MAFVDHVVGCLGHSTQKRVFRFRFMFGLCDGFAFIVTHFIRFRSVTLLIPTHFICITSFSWMIVIPFCIAIYFSFVFMSVSFHFHICIWQGRHGIVRFRRSGGWFRRFRRSDGWYRFVFGSPNVTFASHLLHHNMRFVDDESSFFPANIICGDLSRRRDSLDVVDSNGIVPAADCDGFIGSRRLLATAAAFPSVRRLFLATFALFTMPFGFVVGLVSTASRTTESDS